LDFKPKETQKLDVPQWRVLRPLLGFTRVDHQGILRPDKD